MFRFKQFSMNQDRCAMKIGTDGVLLGALTDVSEVKSILDIGTGTGLISLMLAQRSAEANIHAIEIDKEAAAQALENCAVSPWSERIEVFPISLNEHIKENFCYDLIVSNPPFFINALKAPSEKRTLARHNDELSHVELIEGVNKLLADDGSFWLILPDTEAGLFLNESIKEGLYPAQQINVYSFEGGKLIRKILKFTKKESSMVKVSTFVIYKSRGQHSDQYIQTTKDFFLDF